MSSSTRTNPGFDFRNRWANAGQLLCVVAIMAVIALSGCSSKVSANAIDVGIAISHNGSTFVPGQNASYKIQVGNAGGMPTTGVITVTDTLPSTLTFVSAVGTGWTCNVAGQVVTCTNAGPIAPSGSAGNITLTVAVAANATGTITNTATVSTANDTNSNNNSSTDTVTVGVAAANGCGAARGSESMLNGHYAILLHGFQGTGNGTPVAIAGSFTANGAGMVTGGEEDINNASAPAHLTIVSGSLYTLGPDLRGCVQLSTTSGTTVFRVAVQTGGPIVLNSTIVSKGRIIESDDTTGTGTGMLARAAGILQFQDTSSFSINALSPRYAFGLEGVNSAARHIAIAGSFSANNGTGAVTAGFLDADNGGTLQSAVTGATGNIAMTSGGNGRGTFVYNYSSGGANFQTNAAIYLVNASEFFMVGTDTFGTAHGVISGRAIASGMGFNAAFLSGNTIFSSAGSTLSGTQSLGVATLSQVNFSPNTSGNLQAGTLSGTSNQYTSGDSFGIHSSGMSGTYTIDSVSGRVSLNFGVGGSAPVLYVTQAATGIPDVTDNFDNIAGFVVESAAAAPDTFSSFGTVKFQAAATYLVSQFVLGAPDFLGTDDAADNLLTDEVGSITINSNGTTNTTFDRSGPNGLATTTTPGSIVISPNGTGNVGLKTVLLTNGTYIFYIDGSAGGPAAIIVIAQLGP